MKYIKSLLIIAVLVFVAACSSDNTTVDFGLDTTEIKLGPEGGVSNIRVSADKSWIASADKPWILVSPANGNASTECKIRVDSSLVNHQEKGLVIFSIEGQERKIEITREGFPIEITVPSGSQQISLPDYASSEESYFDVEVTSNSPFSVEIPEDVTWLKTKDFKQVPSVGYRPRTTKIRFLWDINSKPMEQVAEINFVPTLTVAHKDNVKVVQDAAPLIVPGRAGDSISILAIARNLKIFANMFDPSKSMMHWEDVKLWDSKDPKAKEDPSLIGRVKYVKFFMCDTKMSIPYEVQFLTAVDSLVFFSNANRQTRNIELGPEICQLTQLRSLSIIAFGINKLPAEFTNLRNLETLALGSNNFQTLPLDIINKTNFPKLRHLDFNYMRTREVHDLSNNVETDIGITGEIPEELLKWDELEYLALSFCYFEKSIPDMEGYPKYTAEDEAVKKGLTEVGVPKVLPNVKDLRFNGNRLTGNVPRWILKHPKLYDWSPYIFIFNQEGKDTAGKLAGFDNVPDTVEPPTVTD